MGTIKDKTGAELNRRKVPIVSIDESLDKFDNVIISSDKIQKMNEILKKTGHPKNYLKSK